MTTTKRKLVKVVIKEKTKTTNLGLELEKDRETASLIVSQIYPHSSLAKSSLKAGYRIVSIQGKHYSSPGKAMKALRETVGLLTIIADKSDLVHAVARRGIKVDASPNNNNRWGIELNKCGNGFFWIQNIDKQSGIWRKSGLRKGHRVLSINNEILASNNPELTSEIVMDIIEHLRKLEIVATRQSPRLQPETSFALMLVRKPQDGHKDTNTFHVYLNGDPVGDLEHSKESNEVVVHGTIHDTVSIRAWFASPLSFRVVKPGSLTMHIECSPTDGIVASQDAHANRDIEELAFDSWDKTDLGVDTTLGLTQEVAKMSLTKTGIAF